MGSNLEYGYAAGLRLLIGNLMHIAEVVLLEEVASVPDWTNLISLEAELVDHPYGVTAKPQVSLTVHEDEAVLWRVEVTPDLVFELRLESGIRRLSSQSWGTEETRHLWAQQPLPVYHHRYDQPCTADAAECQPSAKKRVPVLSPEGTRVWVEQNDLVRMTQLAHHDLLFISALIRLLDDDWLRADNLLTAATLDDSKHLLPPSTRVEALVLLGAVRALRGESPVHKMIDAIGLNPLSEFAIKGLLTAYAWRVETYGAQTWMLADLDQALELAENRLGDDDPTLHSAQALRSHIQDSNTSLEF